MWQVFSFHYLVYSLGFLHLDTHLSKKKFWDHFLNNLIYSLCQRLKLSENRGFFFFELFTLLRYYFLQILFLLYFALYANAKFLVYLLFH